MQVESQHVTVGAQVHQDTVRTWVGAHLDDILLGFKGFLDTSSTEETLGLFYTPLGRNTFQKRRPDGQCCRRGDFSLLQLVPGLSASVHCMIRNTHQISSFNDIKQDNSGPTFLNWISRLNYIAVYSMPKHSLRCNYPNYPKRYFFVVHTLALRVSSASLRSQHWCARWYLHLM